MRLATTKVTPEDSSEQSARLVEAETKALSPQIRTQCIPAFGRHQ
jgi:hypothetical protein